MNFLQYMLQQEEESLLYRMLNAQQNQPLRGDWYFGVQKIMEEIDIVLEKEEQKSKYEKSAVQKKPQIKM